MYIYLFAINGTLWLLCAVYMHEGNSSKKPADVAIVFLVDFPICEDIKQCGHKNESDINTKLRMTLVLSTAGR